MNAHGNFQGLVMPPLLYSTDTLHVSPFKRFTITTVPMLPAVHLLQVSNGK